MMPVAWVWSTRLFGSNRDIGRKQPDGLEAATPSAAFVPAATAAVELCPFHHLHVLLYIWRALRAIAEVCEWRWSDVTSPYPDPKEKMINNSCRSFGLAHATLKRTVRTPTTPRCATCSDKATHTPITAIPVHVGSTRFDVERSATTPREIQSN